LIYYIQYHEDSLIKIGTTNNLHSRLAQHGLAHDRFKVLGVHEGGPLVERCMHSKFDHLRVGRKELFKPDDDLLDHIKKYTREWDEFSPPRTKLDEESYIVFYAESLEWLRDIAEHFDVKACDIVDKALMEFGQRHRFPKPYPDHPPGKGKVPDAAEFVPLPLFPGI
jgi:hypothetical protein